MKILCENSSMYVAPVCIGRKEAKYILEIFAVGEKLDSYNLCENCCDLIAERAKYNGFLVIIKKIRQ